MAWSSTSDTLAAVTDDKVWHPTFKQVYSVFTHVKVIVWNYPDVLFVDKDMIEATTTGVAAALQLDFALFVINPSAAVTRSTGLGRGAAIKSFVGCNLQVTLCLQPS